MKLSNTTLRELSAKYRSVLRKCAYLNAIAIMGLAFGANADTVAKIGTDEYASLPAAIDAVEDGETIVLQSDVTQGAGKSVAAGSNFTIDFGNKTYTAHNTPAGSTGSETQIFQVLKDGTVTFKNGKINVAQTTAEGLSGNFLMGIQNYSDLTLDNMTVDGTNLLSTSRKSGSTVPRYVVSNNAGDTLIKGSTIIAKAGDFAFDVYDGNDTAYPGGTSVTVQDSTITGNIEVGTGDTTLTFNGTNTVNGNITNAGTVNANLEDTNSTTFKGRIYNTGALEVDHANFDGNENLTDWAGSIYTGSTGTVTVTNSTFTKNKAKTSAALASGVYTTKTHLTNVSFTENTANGAGVVGLFGKDGLVSNVTFKANETTDSYGMEAASGALFLGSVSQTTVNDTLFEENTAAANGGALATRYSKFETKQNDQKDAKLTINTATFIDNTAGKNGGAIFNTFYQNMDNANEGILVKNSSFTGNTAGELGGAIYNDGNEDCSHKKSAAILAGTNTFLNNKDKNGLNDIYNDGALFVNGTLEMSGGINGNGTVNFAEGTVLKNNLKYGISNNALVKASTITTDGEISLLLANGTNGTIFEATDTLDVDVADNTLFNLKKETKTLSASQKTASEIAAQTSYSDDQAGLLATMIRTTQGTNELYDSLTEAVQVGGNDDAVKSELNKMLNPTQASNTAALSVAKENTNIAMGRMAGIAGGDEEDSENTRGKSAGDTDSVLLTPWIQGMFAHTHNTQSDGFTANTKGFALGMDAQINNAWMVGIGYSNVNSRIKTDTSSTRGYGDNGFVYGQYKPSDWYVRGIAGYGRTTYKDHTNDTKWDVDTYSANAFAGYVWGILDTSIGARYTYLDNKSYKSGTATISADDTDNLTAVVDFKVSKEYASKNWRIEPSAHVGFTYDVISADNASTVALGAGYGSYEVNGERLHKAGTEAGTGVIFKNGNSELHLNYEGAFRKDNYTNGGFMKFKYNF